VNSVIKVTTYFDEHFTNRLNGFWITVQRRQSSVSKRLIFNVLLTVHHAISV